MNATAAFLSEGLERIELEDVHPFWGGRRLTVYSDGRVEIEQQPQDRRYQGSADPGVMLQLVVEHDLLGFPDPPPRPLVPDEACPAITLVNGRGERRQRASWANDRVAAFERVYRELLALEQRIATLR